MAASDDRTARLAELRKAVDEAAGQARQLTFLMLTVGLYIGITGLTTTHRMLLVGGTIQMPILNVGVDLVGFYAAAPCFFLALHIWLLGAMLSLSRRVDALNREVERLPGVERRYQSGLVTAFPFVEWRAGFLVKPIDRRLSAAINWAIYVGSPVLLFLWIQVRFLPYQDIRITGLHVFCLLADLFVLWLTWPEINGPGTSRLHRMSGALGTALAGLAAVLLAANGPLPWVRQHLPADWTRLKVTNQILMKREPPPQVVAVFLARAEKGREEEAQLEAFLDKDMAVPLNLSGRSLRHADLTRSRMPGLVLDGETDLDEADLSSTDLTKAVMSGASLRGAGLVGASLEGASLIGASLQGASLQGASLQRARLDGASLQGAGLEGALLQGASLVHASLQGAGLNDASLQGATLAYASLQGAILSDASLQGAKLAYATLQGASLVRTSLQGASLWRASLQGANLDGASLHGADLRRAELWRALIPPGTDLALADLRKSSLHAPGRVEAMIKEALRRIDDPEVAGVVEHRLARVLSVDHGPWLAPAASKRRNALTDERAEAIRDLLTLGPSTDLAVYAALLNDMMAPLFCSDSWVAQGLLARARFEGAGRAELSGRQWPELARRVTDPMNGCPAIVAQLSDYDQKALQELAAAGAPEPSFRGK